MTRVSFTREARSDLRAITVFIAGDSQSRAEDFVGRLESACLGLAEHPHRYAVLLGFEQRAYRRRPLGNYSIIYIAGDAIEVVRILHSAMNIAAELGD